MELDQAKIEAAIVEQAVDKLVYTDESLYERIKSKIDAKLEEQFARVATPLIEKTVTEAVQDGLNQTYTPVDSYGTATGEPTTIKRELEKNMRAYWQQQVNRSGKTADGPGYNTMSRADWMLAQACGDDFKKMIRTEAVNATAVMKDSLRAILTEKTAEMVDTLFAVRTPAYEGKQFPAVIYDRPKPTA